MEYAQICAESCEKHNLPYEFIDAVEFLNCKKAFKSVGTYKNGNYHIRDGNCCCHASHIKCWKRIVELNKACIILEHDAVVKGNVRNIDIPDMATVTFGHTVLVRHSIEQVPRRSTFDVLSFLLAQLWRQRLQHPHERDLHLRTVERRAITREL